MEGPWPLVPTFTASKEQTRQRLTFQTRRK